MSTPPAPARLAILEVLADGRWHDREAVIVAAMRVVPPGQAFRVGEAQRFRTVPEGQARTRGDRARSIESGRRRVAMDAMFTLLRFDVIERDRVGDRLRRR